MFTFEAIMLAIGGIACVVVLVIEDVRKVFAPRIEYLTIHKGEIVEGADL